MVSGGVSSPVSQHFFEKISGALVIPKGRRLKKHLLNSVMKALCLLVSTKTPEADSSHDRTVEPPH